VVVLKVKLRARSSKERLNERRKEEEKKEREKSEKFAYILKMSQRGNDIGEGYELVVSQSEGCEE